MPLEKCLQLILLPLVALQLAWASESASALPEGELPNVTVTAMPLETVSPSESKVVFTLILRPKVAIYANRPQLSGKGLLTPTTIELLDREGNVVPAKLRFPMGQLVKNEIVGDYYVYTGTIQITATFQTANAATSARIKYHGYHYRNTVDQGYL